MSDVTRDKIEKWVHLAIKDQDILSPRIETEGQSSKGDGFSGDINFVRVTGKTKEGKPKVISLAIKSSKTNEILRSKVPVKELYAKEMLIYERLAPEFEQLLRDNGLEQTVDFLPRYYGSEVTENSEVLILENLRPAGFEMWDKTRPMPHDHAALVLEAYAKWHAMSMALKVRKPEVFEDVNKNNVNAMSHMLDKMQLDLILAQQFETTRNAVIRDDERDILEHLQFSASDVRNILGQMLLEEPEYHVNVHGDCWTNNFLFKYLDKSKPSGVVILDWQQAGLASVAADLSHFIYCCVDTGKHGDVKELLKLYYDTFSKYLILLGCDPEAVLSFGKLLEQWKKFSRFGLVISCWMIRLCLMKQNDIPDVDDAIIKDQNVADAMNIQASSDDLFNERVRNNFVHYAKNVQ